jgi:hypothetical protein
MSTPLEQARAIAMARHFLSELCVPGKIKRIPREVRREARNRLKHMPMSWDLQHIVKDEGAMEHMRETERYYRDRFWEDMRPAWDKGAKQ